MLPLAWRLKREAERKVDMATSKPAACTMNSSVSPKEGAKGSDVYGGSGDKRVDLSVRMVRGASGSELSILILEVARYHLEDAFVMAFHSRNVRGGKGERVIFAELFKALVAAQEPLATHLLDLIPHYGSWRDLLSLIDSCPANSPYDRLKDSIYGLIVKQLQEDAVKPVGSSISLAGKWAPREHSANDEHAKALAGLLFPGKPDARKRYRQLVAGLNRRLDTIETHMCGGSWADIKPATVPGRAGKLYAKALLNESRSEKGAFRFPESEDRMACREHFKEHFAAAAAGKATVHGAKTVFPHEVVKKAKKEALTEPEKDQLRAVWASMIADLKAGGGLDKAVLMADFSGSMQSAGIQGDTPYWVSMALGILGSCATNGKFMTFDSTPKWHHLPSADLFECLDSIGRHVSQGTSTDFQAACDLLLSDLKAARCKPGEEPKFLLVLTDMNWDQACASNGVSQFTGSSYRHHVKTAPWQTHLDMIKESFRRAGEDMHGPGFALTPPQIVIWNLAANPTHFHATADTPGVSLLSGWSPSQFKILMKEGPRCLTPLETLRLELDDPQYDVIRERIVAFLKKAE